MPTKRMGQRGEVVCYIHCLRSLARENSNVNLHNTTHIPACIAFVSSASAPKDLVCRNFA